MQQDITIYKPNNRPIYYALIILVAAMVSLIVYKDNQSAVVLYAGFGLICYFLSVVMLMLIKNRTVIISQSGMSVRHFRTDIFLDLAVFNVTVFLKKDRVSYFLFDSAQLAIKIFPATYLQEEALASQVSKLLRRQEDVSVNTING